MEVQAEFCSDVYLWFRGSLLYLSKPNLLKESKKGIYFFQSSIKSALISSCCLISLALVCGAVCHYSLCSFRRTVIDHWEWCYRLLWRPEETCQGIHAGEQKMRLAQMTSIRIDLFMERQQIWRRHLYFKENLFVIGCFKCTAQLAHFFC